MKIEEKDRIKYCNKFVIQILKNKDYQGQQMWIGKIPKGSTL